MHRKLFFVDTTVVSNFSIVGGVHLLDEAMRGRWRVAEAVSAEVRTGVALGRIPSPGELRVEKLSEKEKRLAASLRRALGPGESECIALAKERGGIFCSDDLAARRMANSMGVPVVGTLGILLSLVQGGVLTLEEADSLLKEMMDRGYRSPVETISELVQDKE